MASRGHEAIGAVHRRPVLRGFHQTRREVKTLTDDAWARLQQIRATHDPNGLFADYLAGPGGFRNRNGWETYQ